MIAVMVWYSFPFNIHTYAHVLVHVLQLTSTCTGKKLIDWCISLVLRLCEKKYLAESIEYSWKNEIQWSNEVLLICLPKNFQEENYE